MPNRLWFSDFTYVATWAGFVYVAFVIDAYAGEVPVVVRGRESLPPSEGEQFNLLGMQIT